MKQLSITLVAAVILASCSSSDSNDNSMVDNVVDDDIGGADTLDQDSVINARNAEQLLKDVIGVLNLDSMDPMRLQARLLGSDIADSDNAVLNGRQPMEGLTLASQIDLPNANKELTYTCNGEGSVTSFYHELGGGPIIRRDVLFNGCLATDVLLNGRYQYAAGRRADEVETFTGYSAAQDNSEQQLSGEWTAVYSHYSIKDEHIWTDATFTSTGTANDIQLDSFNWNRLGIDSINVAPESRQGYVQDAEGITRAVANMDYAAELESDFQFSNTSTGGVPVQVSVSLTFEGNYITWNEPYGVEPEEPGYPVSDLGTPLVFSTTRDFEAGVEMIDNFPKDIDAQWQTGELSITASDGSTVRLRPSSDDKTLIEIELNASGDTQIRSWSEGFRIDCPSVIDGCGGAKIE